MSPDELIDACIEELRRVYGDEIASEGGVERSGTWYYLHMAVRTKNGLKVELCPKPIRRSEFEAALKVLHSIGERKSC